MYTPLYQLTYGCHQFDRVPSTFRSHSRCVDDRSAATPALRALTLEFQTSSFSLHRAPRVRDINMARRRVLILTTRLLILTTRLLQRVAPCVPTERSLPRPSRSIPSTPTFGTHFLSIVGSFVKLFLWLFDMRARSDWQPVAQPGIMFFMPSTHVGVEEAQHLLFQPSATDSESPSESIGLSINSE